MTKIIRKLFLLNSSESRSTRFEWVIVAIIVTLHGHQSVPLVSLKSFFVSLRIFFWVMARWRRRTHSIVCMHFPVSEWFIICFTDAQSFVASLGYFASIAIQSKKQTQKNHNKNHSNEIYLAHKEWALRKPMSTSKSHIKATLRVEQFRSRGTTFTSIFLYNIFLLWFT